MMAMVSSADPVHEVRKADRLVALVNARVVALAARPLRHMTEFPLGQIGKVLKRK